MWRVRLPQQSVRIKVNTCLIGDKIQVRVRLPQLYYSVSIKVNTCLIGDKIQVRILGWDYFRKVGSLM